MGDREERMSGLPERRESAPMASPDIAYEPPEPDEYDPGIALIGTGDISEVHLRAYRKAGYNVVALCNRTHEKAERRRQEFFPDADVYTDHTEVLARDDVAVVDITIPPEPRVGVIEDALRADKHVLSQKPFVTDLDVGRRLVALADDRGVRLAVNQNGRWAPHFSYIRAAVGAGLLGDVVGAHAAVHWNHDRSGDPEFDALEYAILYDFAIHWFDMIACIMRDREPKRVYASRTRTATQAADPPLLGQAVVEYEGAQASLVFDGHTRFGPQDSTYVAGRDGSVVSQGPEWTEQEVTLYTEEGHATPDLKGSWFPDGFRGAMGELLCAIEDRREPSHAARTNLGSLELCFAAVASAEDHEPKVPGEVSGVEP